MSALPDPKWIDKVLASVQKRGGRVIIGELTIEAVALDETHPLSADSDNFDDEAEIDKLAAKISGTA